MTWRHRLSTPGLCRLLACALLLLQAEYSLASPAMNRSSSQDHGRVATVVAIDNKDGVDSGSLSSAIASASAGDTLIVLAGRHAGPLIIDKPLYIRGEPGAIIDAGGVGSVIEVNAADVTLESLTVIGSGDGHQPIDAGIRLTEEASGARILDNVLSGNQFGIDVHGAQDALVSGNTITGRRGHRMNERGNGIYVWNAPGTVILNNQIRYGRDGIFVNTSENNEFRGNTMEDLRFGIHYMYANNSTVSDNVSRNNHLGYALMYSTNLIVRNNSSTGDRDHGIMLNYANESIIEGNDIRQSKDKCLFMYNANGNEVRGNRFSECLIGIHFTAGSERNTITGNAFIGNRTQVKYVGTKYHEWSDAGRGNYWSDHTAFDVNADGIADQRYRPNDVMDQVLWTQPSAALLLGSPAVQLLRWAQRQFPSLLPGGVVDSSPLVHIEDVRS